MKIGFSSAVCPGWELDRMVACARERGFDGVELRGLGGELDLTAARPLTGNVSSVRALFTDHQIELVCLGSSVTLTARKAAERARQRLKLVDTIELAAKLGCPRVRFHAGTVDGSDSRELCLSRLATELALLTGTAARNGVTLMVENGGDFAGSSDLWFLIDAVGHPLVRAVWNQFHATTLRERPTISIPRLGNKIGMVHICDGDFDESGVLLEYKVPGEGMAEIGRQIDLLRGLAWQGYLVFEWPRMWVDTLPPAEAALPGVASYLRGKLDETQKTLTAYKNDKNAPKFVAGS